MTMRERALARYTARWRDAVRKVQDDADRLARLSGLSRPRAASPARCWAAAGGLLRWRDERTCRVQQEDPAWLYHPSRPLGARWPTLRRTGEPQERI